MNLQIVETKLEQEGNPIKFELIDTDNWNLIGTCVIFLQDTESIYKDPISHMKYYESKGLAYINSLHIEDTFRRRGYGMQLLRYVMDYAYSRGLRYIELDDVSDYSTTHNSIYVKAGFIYDQGDNHMICNLRHAQKLIYIFNRCI